MKKYLLATVLGGLTIFVWGSFSHMVLPIGDIGMKSLPNEEVVIGALKTAVPEPGLYWFPGFDMHAKNTPEQETAWKEKYRSGPAGMLVYKPVGGDVMPPSMLISEFVSNVLAAGIAAFVALFLVGSYGKRVLVLASLGLFAWFSVNVSYWTWYNFPASFVLAEGFDTFMGSLLSGLVIAKFIPSAKQS